MRTIQVLKELGFWVFACIYMIGIRPNLDGYVLWIPDLLICAAIVLSLTAYILRFGRKKEY
ncbi:hypothetical protein CHH91_11100 [Virgibacillus sp. 7505]|uniref:hypothetical protein n=1 Tax=Virgibacillus sp. 7505 TaxID=2022548 RepID=UPI000BA608ED|nr:hypothetical protein [Virgibacillus sp. 7505]PAE16169.1 hypothetical protein CHH91_11100 [Virgibacillus sp. 7505]